MRKIGIAISRFIRKAAERIDLIDVVFQIAHDVKQQTVLDGGVVKLAGVFLQKAAEDGGNDIVERICGDCVGHFVLILGVQSAKCGTECSQEIGTVAQNRVFRIDFLTNLVQKSG